MMQCDLSIFFVLILGSMDTDVLSECLEKFENENQDRSPYYCLMGI